MWETRTHCKYHCCQKRQTPMALFDRLLFRVICCHFPGLFYLEVYLFLSTDSFSASLSLFPGFCSTHWPQNRYRSTWAAAKPKEVKGKFWVAVTVVCSPSFHLSFSFSAPLLSPLSPGPRWRYSDWYAVDSRQQIPDSVSAILSCSSCFLAPSPKGFLVFITVFFPPPKTGRDRV